MIEFDKTLMKFPNIRRFVGGASNDLIPNLQNPDNPVPLLKEQIERMGDPHVARRRRLIRGRSNRRGGPGRPFL